MKYLLIALLVFANIPSAPAAEHTPYADQIQKWRATREEKLCAANSWLSLVGRYPLRPGLNTFGTGKNNDVIFPAALAGVGPARLGTLDVDPTGKKSHAETGGRRFDDRRGKPFTGERVSARALTSATGSAWDRLSMHIIARDGKYVLRLADNESPLRTHFPGCVWYPPDAAYKLEAKFVPYLAGRTLSIVNIIGETSQQPCPGYAEFQLHGQTHRLDAIAENGGLFFVFRDATAGDTTYGASRFLDIEKQPQDNESFTFDFNKAYNPPCAFSEFTTCPLPPKQNILKTRIEAGEKYQGRHRERPVRVSGALKVD